MSLEASVFFCRNYYARTQTFTVISATKQIWVLSSSRHVSLTDLRKTLPETQDPSEVKRESLRQRTSSGTCGYSGTWAQAQGLFLETLTGCPEPWVDQNSGCDSRSWGRFQQGK